MQTICGIKVELFTKQPTPEEMGNILANMNSEQQALFFLSLGEELRNCCAGSHFMQWQAIQWQAIADSIKLLEEKLCDGSASQLIDELQQRLVKEIS